MKSKGISSLWGAVRPACVPWHGWGKWIMFAVTLFRCVCVCCECVGTCLRLKAFGAHTHPLLNYAIHTTHIHRPEQEAWYGQPDRQTAYTGSTDNSHKNASIRIRRAREIQNSRRARALNGMRDAERVGRVDWLANDRWDRCAMHAPAFYLLPMALARVVWCGYANRGRGHGHEREWEAHRMQHGTKVNKTVGIRRAGLADGLTGLWKTEIYKQKETTTEIWKY